jgi:hypothetical protein
LFARDTIDDLGAPPSRALLAKQRSDRREGAAADTSAIGRGAPPPQHVRDDVRNRLQSVEESVRERQTLEASIEDETGRLNHEEAQRIELERAFHAGASNSPVSKTARGCRSNTRTLRRRKGNSRAARRLGASSNDTPLRARSFCVNRRFKQSSARWRASGLKQVAQQEGGQAR